jgi:predicted  nucleic acid-binding Zn-ribbon protein
MDIEKLDILQTKINDLLAKFEEQQNQKKQIEQDYTHLKEQFKALESQMQTMALENKRLEKDLQERNDAALKRIGRLVDKIDQFQSEMKFS